MKRDDFIYQFNTIIQKLMIEKLPERNMSFSRYGELAYKIIGEYIMHVNSGMIDAYDKIIAKLEKGKK
jgi:hypothetical protein